MSSANVFGEKCYAYHHDEDMRSALYLRGGNAMDAKYFREKAELCLRLADGLSLNNPGRFQLIDLADDSLERAKELEANKVKEKSIRHEAA